jgi:group II intron reverse transcriptase/maturase
VIEPRKVCESEEPRQSSCAIGHGIGVDESSETQVLFPGSESSAHTHRSSARKPGDLDGASLVTETSEERGEGPESRNPEKYTDEESDEPVVPEKSPNSRVTPEEAMEGRGEAKGKPADGNTFREQTREDVLTIVERVGERAKQKRGEKFTTLLSHVKVPLLKEAYQRLRKNAAAGVDGQTWSSYGEQLEARLLDLQARVHRGSYHPQPVRRVHIPKGDGRMRPLGIPALEDKIVQQAVRMLLEPVYEYSEFIGFSYGFRPGRSQHMALDALAEALQRKVSWVLDADIRSFFDTVDHGWMQKFLEHRIGDRRLVRLLMKWLKAGVMEEGKLHETQAGTPQGGVISPLLANIYLHYVIDLWVQQWRTRNARGQMYVVRYADDLVMGFQREEDARAMQVALAARLAEFGLELHPDKTHVLRFGRFARQDAPKDGRTRPETFEFLGFTHISAEDREGRYRLLRRTSRKKRVAKLRAVRKEMLRRICEPVTEQHGWLSSVVRGHYQYYGVPGNSRALNSFRESVRYLWHKRLQRRSQRASWTTQKRTRFDRRFPLPAPRIIHPYPTTRFRDRHAHR